MRLRARSRKSLISRKKKKEEAKVKETQKELKKLGDKYKRLEAAPKQIRERTLAAQKSATRAQAAAAAMNIQLKDVGGKKTQLVGKMKALQAKAALLSKKQLQYKSGRQDIKIKNMLLK